MHGAQYSIIAPMAITQKTVLVLGAGASHPYGFPLGEELLKGIARGIRFDHPEDGNIPVKRILLDSGFSASDLTSFAEQLDSSGLYSIDEFLQTHPDLIKLGTNAIAAYLIPFEKLSSLLSGPNPKSEWYRYLLQLMGTTRPERTTTRANLSIVTYNYDRSLEYFLYNALTAGCNVSRGETIKLLQTLPIIHIHGQLGFPDFLLNGFRPYSPEASPQLLMMCAQQIKIIHNVEDDTDELTSARKLIADARYVVFLGFGYHPTNIDRLRLAWSADDKFGGTAYHLEPNEVSRAKRSLHGSFALGKIDEDILLFMKRHPLWDVITK
jgi:hypothetical protein